MSDDEAETDATLLSGSTRRDHALADTMAAVLDAASVPADDARRVEPDARYAVLGVLGEGGMGRVYEVTDRELGRSVALKELGFEGTTVELARRFLVEALVTANLEHPGIVPVYERGVRNGRPYYTMRRLPSRTLADAFAEVKTDVARLALLPALTRVAETLAYAHARGVVHRDIKPSNVVLGEFGAVTVIDWGIAKITVADKLGLSEKLPAAASPATPTPTTSDQTLTGALLGTPAYMAPEQAMGRNADVDARTDVFAVGALLYELLSGRPPYEGTTALALVAAAIEGTYPSIDSLAPRVPASLRAICKQAMARDPEARHRSAADLARALDNALTDAWVDRESRAVRSVGSVLTAFGVVAAAAGLASILGRLPALERLGFGLYPILICATLATMFGAADWFTRGRHRLRTMTLVFIAMTFASGVLGTLMGLLSSLRRASSPAVIADELRWRELLTSEVYSGLGNTILGLALAIALTLAWAATRRRTDAALRDR